MDIVCYSAQFPPENSPESFCTARFLSALAENGCHIHLVTLDAPPGLDADIVRELVSPKIKITRLPFYRMVPEPVWKRFLKRKSLPYDWHYWSPKNLTAILSGILKDYKAPILHTRSDPLEPQFLLRKMRREAQLWIPHFADPAPLPFPRLVEIRKASLYNRLRDANKERKIAAVIRDADLVSVTCRNAVRYFDDLCGGGQAEKFHVNTHVGAPRLAPGGFQYPRNGDDTFEIVHVGSLLQERYPQQVIREFRHAASQRPDLRLILFGAVDGISEEEIQANRSWLRVIQDRALSPRDATDAQAQADMILIVDAETTLPYCPFLASKFAYATDLGRPILGVSIDDSEMANLAKEHGGMSYVNILREGELAARLIVLDKNSCVLPNRELRTPFTPEDVASKFIARLDRELSRR